MKHIWKKGFLTLLMALIFTMAVPSILPTETSMGTVEAATVKISAKKATIVKGKTKTLKIKGTSKKVTWSSSNKSVATVNKNGKVTAKKAGTATITAKVGGKKYKCKVTVENPKISSKSLTLKVGETSKLKVSGTTQSVTWSSSKKSVATVSKSGKVTAKKAGTATITAKVGGKNLKCTVKVKKSSSTSSSGLDITILSSTDITSSTVSKVSFKIQNNGSKTVKFDNGFTVVNYTSGYYKGLPLSSSVDGLPLPMGDSDTTSISPGKTKTITITDDTYSFKGNAKTYYNLWFTIGNSRYRYDFYPVSGKGTAVLIDG